VGSYRQHAPCDGGWRHHSSRITWLVSWRRVGGRPGKFRGGADLRSVWNQELTYLALGGGLNAYSAMRNDAVSFMAASLGRGVPGLNLMLETIRHLLSLIRFSQTLFALPLAMFVAMMAWHLRAIEMTKFAGSLRDELLRFSAV